LVQEEMIISEMRSGYVPVKIFRLQVEGKHIREQDVERARDVAHGIRFKVGRRLERRHSPRFGVGNHRFLLSTLPLDESQQVRADLILAGRAHSVARERPDYLTPARSNLPTVNFDGIASRQRSVLLEHKPVQRGHEMIDRLAVEEPEPKPTKIRAGSYEAAIDQLFKRMRSSSPALTQQAVSNPRSPVPNERRRRRPPHGRRTETTGEWPPATRGSPPAPAEDGPGRGPPPRGRVRSRCTSRGARTRPGTRRRRRTSAGRRRTPGGPRCARGCGRRCDGRPPPAPPRTRSRTSAFDCGTHSRTAWPSAEARPGTRAAWRRGRNRATPRTRPRRPPGGPAGPDAAGPSPRRRAARQRGPCAGGSAPRRSRMRDRCWRPPVAGPTARPA